MASASLQGAAPSAAPFAVGSASRGPTKPASRKRLSLSRTGKATKEGGRGTQRSGISKFIRAPLKTAAAKLASKVPRRGKRSAAAKLPLSLPAPPATAHLQCEPSSGSGSRTSGGSPVSSDLDDSCREAVEGGRRRLSLLLEENPPSPLREAAPLAPAHSIIQSPESSPRSSRPREQEELPVHRSPSTQSNHTTTSSHSTASSCSEGYRIFLSFVSSDRSSFELCDPPPPSFVDTTGQGNVNRSPSFLDGLAVSASDEALEVVIDGAGATASAPIPPAETKAAAESPFASCGYLSTLLGAPAPQAGVADRDLDHILPGEAVAQESHVTRQEASHGVQHGAYPGRGPQDAETEDDACSIPSICSVDAQDLVCDQSGNAAMVVSDKAGNAEVIVCKQSSVIDCACMSDPVPLVGDIVPAVQATTAGEAADSALMWGCVTAFLGAPAPQAVRFGGKKRQRSGPVNLWRDEAEAGDMDDIVSLSEDEDPDDSDHCSILEHVQLDVQETDCVPQVVEQVGAAGDDDSESSSLGALSLDLHELDDTEGGFVHEKVGVKEEADSALAWGALGMLLGSSAPKAVPKRKVLRQAAPNLWCCESTEHDDLETVPFMELDEDGADSISSMSAGVLCIDLHELEGAGADDDYSGSADQKVGVEEEADSALALGVLGMILGSSAPKAVPKKRRVLRQATSNLWHSDAMDNDGLDTVPSMELDEGDTGSISSSSHDVLSIDLHELEDADDKDICFVHDKVGVKEEADSALALGALGMLLGSSAPKSVPKKRKVWRQAAHNLWYSEAMGSDGLDTIPSIEEEDDNTGSISSMQSQEPLDDGIIAGLEEFVLANDTTASPENDNNGKEAADSVMAWSALAALLGAPAPRSIVGKKIKRINLWDDDQAMMQDLDDLLPLTQDNNSREEDSKEATLEKTQQVALHVQACSQKGFRQDDDDDTHSIPSLSASYDSSSSSQLTV